MHGGVVGGELESLLLCAAADKHPEMCVFPAATTKRRKTKELLTESKLSFVSETAV